MLHSSMVLMKIRTELGLLERHIKILRILEEKGPLGIVKLSYLTNTPPHQVRYSLRILQQSGFLQPTTKGAMLNSRARNFISGFEKEKKSLTKRIASI